jgi:hypothetical protein
MEKKELREELKSQDVVADYLAQTEKDEDIHFEHYDWTYNDSSCCC